MPKPSEGFQAGPGILTGQEVEPKIVRAVQAEVQVSGQQAAQVWKTPIGDTWVHANLHHNSPQQREWKFEREAQQGDTGLHLSHYGGQPHALRWYNASVWIAGQGNVELLCILVCIQG
jgi:hypothetical protein